MNPYDDALAEVMETHDHLSQAQQDVDNLREDFAISCRRAHEAGIPDRVIADETGYSRARIQQFRCGDPRKAKASV